MAGKGKSTVDLNEIDDMEEHSGMQRVWVIGVVIFPFLLPFVFANPIVVAGYFLFVVCWFLFLLGLVSAEISMRPPWYRPTTPEQGLTEKALPEYWMGVVHNPKYDMDIDYEVVEFPAVDGKTMRGWLVPGKNPTSQCGVITVHGGGRDRRAHLRHVQLFHEAGVATLLFDQREHGISDGSGKGSTYGRRESEDVCSAVDFVTQELGWQHVALVAASIGAASALVAASRDERVSCVVAEAAPASPKELVSFHIQQQLYNYVPHLHEQPTFSRLFVKFATSIFLWRIGAGVLFKVDFSARNAVKTMKTPVLYMHGTADEIVPLNHSEVLYDLTAGPKELWIAQDVWHCAMYDKKPEEFKVRVLAFFRKHLKCK